ncbi:GNAT family N-acetyltransferase [Paenibacillus sp. HJL G12]|uniref:GNAT family N-acetyltransferase n=1 Tax=Paenibacillus dendrobii TaxID=2691084 RepID=A0A7X3IHQ5_9BACL|nr:GNAT family N-acetyltransferase [Paenibacillus dendrobii]MWV43691.1 GNAT family N-acetyltransferase [Paenibacillus dendrobii]
MKTVIVRNVEELLHWEAAWKELMDNLEYPEIFHTWEWVVAYLSHLFSKEQQLFVVVVTDEQQCIAIAPLCITEQKIKWLKVRSLQFIVSGTGETNSFYIHKNVHYIKVFMEIFKALQDHKNEWDWIDLHNVQSQHPVTALILQACGSFFDVYSTTKSMTPYVNLERFHDDKLARSRIKAIERKERKLKKEHDMKLEIHTPIDQRTWSRFTDMHKLRWTHSLFGDENTMSFYRDVISKFHETDNAHFSYVEINGSIASAMLTFCHSGKVYLYITSFSQQYKEYGVGLILLNRVMEHYLQSGALEIDLMSGAQEYKFFWSDTVRLNNHIRLINHGKGRKWIKAYTLLQMNKNHIKSLLSKTSGTG